MKVIKTYPRLLGKYIRFFYSVQASPGTDKGTIHRRLPDGTLDLIINLGSSVFISRDGICFFEMPRALLSGLHADRSFLKYEGKVHLMGAVFEPGYAHLFVNDTLEVYRSCNFDASAVYGSDIGLLSEQLLETPSEMHKHDLLEQFLIARMKRRSEKNVSGIPAVVSNIHAADGNIKMSELYGSHFMSERNFRRKFLEQVGMSPKQYSTIIRIKAFSKYFDQERSLYSNIIDRLGYNDQPHFNREFQKIVGVNPTEYFSQLGRIGTGFIHLI